MLCPPPTTLNPVTIFEAARLPHRANPSRAAGSFSGPCGQVAVAHLSRRTALRQ
jgi:hypothetical protein